MIQGTTSHAGKSVLVAGFCRLFKEKGYKVAPFKPQNMALNSAVTVDGGEIGRSQAVQALAAGIAPHSDMNPVLLKPNSDQSVQVIIQGQAEANMDAIAYHRFKETAMDHVLESYHRLARNHDLIVIEGAGSPAEINLREHDIANMGFATQVNAPVLIVSDIDRGGVFAHLSGTLNCLTEQERKLVKGFIINRFRGNRTLLDPGIDWLESTTGIPTLGVLPFLKGFHMEAEDSVNPQSQTRHESASEKAILRIVVPRLPRISNHTDFDVLRLHPDVDIQFIEENQAIPCCDLMILPGSKNTISDLNWLIRHHWDTEIKRHLRYGGKLIGLCGGYQMIGTRIHDPQGVEGVPGSQNGLGLMDFETVLEPVKQLVNVSGVFHNTDVPVKGYEIHMGKTSGSALTRPAIDLGDRQDGIISGDHQILCSYLHGLFDGPDACDWLLHWAGLQTTVPFDYHQLRMDEIRRLSKMMESEINIDRLCDLIGLDRQSTPFPLHVPSTNP